MHRVPVAGISLALLTPLGVLAQDFQFMPFATRAKTSLLPVPAAWLGYAVEEDMNFDGRSDLFVSFNGAAADVFTRSATGWVVPTTWPLYWSTQRPVLVDLDGDGDRDFVGVPPCVSCRPPLLVYANTPSGVTAVTMPWPATMRFHGVAVGDIHTDGFPDMVVAKAEPPYPYPGMPQTGSLALARGGPGLQFTLDTTSLPAGLPFAVWPELLDVDGDGDLDVLATTVTTTAWGSLLLLRNSGGSFVDATTSLPPMRIGHTWLKAMDLDGDGRTDCAAITWNGDLDVLWGAPGGLTFAFAVATVPGVLGLYPADLDGDLDVDLLAEHRFGLDVLWNQGNRQFVTTNVVNQRTALCGVADVDLDGVTDIVFSASNDPTWLRWLDRGRYEDAAFRVGFEPWTEAAFPQVLGAAGDLDGDGRTDLVTLAERQVTVDQALGGGAYRRSTTLRPFGNPPGMQGRSDLADMDRDGDLDLVVTDSSTFMVWTNNGAGSFHVVLQGTSVSTLNRDDLRLADLDGNGLPDIVLADSRGTVLIVNRGSGQYDPPVVIVPTAAPQSRCVEVADVDGDGDLDVITDRFNSPAHEIAVNDGAGNFTVALSVNLGQTPTSVRAGDIDGDGDSDLLAVGQSGGLRVLRNDGSGHFTDTSQFDLPPGSSAMSIVGNVALADLDGDGDLDAAAMRSGLAPCLLLFNDSSGRFVDVSAARATLALPTIFGYWGLRAADFDDDGDVDLIAGSGIAQIVLANHLRQCRSNALPRLGGVADLHLISGPNFGAPGLGLLGVGFALAWPPLQLAGLDGQLELDPATMQVMAAVTTSSTGVASALVPVPHDAALFGLEVWFQGAILASAGAPPGFTNAVYEVVLR